jgi:hypothetical protein
MYLRSSISSSDLRRYLIVLACVLGTLLTGLAAFTAAGYGLGIVDTGNAEIYDYQLKKIEHLKKADIVFVGDSSLGNGIDAKYFTDLSGLTTANLALSGSYGLGGSLNMIHRVLKNGDHPKAVVIMQSITTMTKSHAFAGYFFSAPPLSKLSLPPDKILEIYLNLGAAKQILRQLMRKGLHIKQPAITNDYLEQRWSPNQPAEIIEAKLKPLLPDMIAEGQLEYLAQIANLCRSSRLICIYAHGPVYEGYCQEARAYLERLDTKIRLTGLHVLSGTPVCLEQNEIGDSIDHVKPDLKQVFTRRYFELFRKTLAQIATGSGQSGAAKSTIQ